MRIHTCLLFAALLLAFSACKTAAVNKEPDGKFSVIAYYAGDGSDLGQYEWDQMTQVIFSFCHLLGNELVVDNAQDVETIRKLVALKKDHPQLKVLLSLGGWGGCAPCSDVFATAEGRREFALSVKELMRTYGADGIDLDWEYPVIEGFPGHKYAPEDKQNFTLLVRELRKTLGRKAEISFAAGGFPAFFDQSVEWSKVMPLVNRVNLMSYDLVSGFSKMTGHHTPLMSTAAQEYSVDHGVRYLRNLGVPAHKIVIGSAFYARVWEQVENVNNGLYQPGKFKAFVFYKDLEKNLPASEGFVFYRDAAAQAPYAYSPARKEYATFDDATSISMKTKFALAKGLGGIMFWELRGDKPDNGLLQAIHLSVLQDKTRIK